MNNEIPKSDYEIFREEKHESLNAPHAVIVDAAEKATGASVSSEKRIIAGETNEVHEIILSESKLKITDHDTVQLVNRAHEIIIAQADSLPVISPKLLHGDFGPQHILIKDGEISGVIDFEFAKGSDPTEEFARWELKFKDYPLEYIQAGYGNKELFEGDFERRKYIWRLFQGLAIMRYCAREGKQFGIDKIVPELRKSVDYFI